LLTSLFSEVSFPFCGIPTSGRRPSSDGIKDEFKDPDSVQVSEGDYAYMKDGDDVDYSEFYVIATVRAKNSFGGYGDPTNYIIHYRNGKYSIEGEYNDKLLYDQKKFNELGCYMSLSLE